jgi:hypothetical protein
LVRIGANDYALRDSLDALSLPLQLHFIGPLPPDSERGFAQLSAKHALTLLFDEALCLV